MRIISINKTFGLLLMAMKENQLIIIIINYVHSKKSTYFAIWYHPLH